MPGLHQKLLIFAAVDGLFLLPTNPKSSEAGVRIDYGTSRVTSTSAKDERINSNESNLETYGVVGILNLVASSHLISITKREQVAQIWGKEVFRIADVTLIPLRSREEAKSAIADAQKTLKQGRPGATSEQLEQQEEGDVGDEAETSTIGSVDTVDIPSGERKPHPEDEAAALEPPKSGVLKKSSTLVKNVVQDRGKYARFATRWFGLSGSKEGVRKQQGMPSEEADNSLTQEQEQEAERALPDQGELVKAEQKDGHDAVEVNEETEDRVATRASRQQTAIEYLTPRILRSARLYFSSSGFYFSYEHDLSRNLSQKTQLDTSPLWRRFDLSYFWNHNLAKPFVDADQHPFVLPLLQGFVGQRAFSVAETEGPGSDVVAEKGNGSNEQDDQTGEKLSSSGVVENREAKHDFLLTLISRRSIQRAGLRYLRRGIDDDGAVANNVETEQILSSPDWSESDKTFSLVQTRGSMPLFFSQSPYSFKPVPVMFGSDATNQGAFQKHFQNLARRYGSVQVASLVDRHGTEVSVGEAYEKHARTLNENGGIDGKSLGFEWFDFHGACKGMKFENVQILMDKIQGQLEDFAWEARQNGTSLRKQTGILRTNCMDCLDRTNVVQSAVASWALQQQLVELGHNIDLKSDPKTQWFNTLWADNGDAISKQYAGTSALKGDFTRTRKRNWTGALADFSLTLNRYYNNIFGDYFLQTNIDYFLGNADPSVFDDFETNMTSQDYALDMKQIRRNAIDTCIKIVLEDPKEDVLKGWTLSCPHQSNTLRTLPFEECILLLTDKALYLCRFDWNTDKVGSFERVDLVDIKEMWRGAYITSSLGSAHLDEAKNVGFALRYQTRGPGSNIRTNTRSLSVVEGAESIDDNQEDEKDKEVPSSKSEAQSDCRLLAFKALSQRSPAAKDDDQDGLQNMSQTEFVKHICDEIYRAMATAWTAQQGFQHIPVEKAPDVTVKDVISVAEAKKSTGYLESLGYGLKKLVWS